MSHETHSELDQANLRIVVAAIAIIYIGALGFFPVSRWTPTCR